MNIEKAIERLRSHGFTVDTRNGNDAEFTVYVKGGRYDDWYRRAGAISIAENLPDLAPTPSIPEGWEPSGGCGDDDQLMVGTCRYDLAGDVWVSGPFEISNRTMGQLINDGLAHYIRPVKVEPVTATVQILVGFTDKVIVLDRDIQLNPGDKVEVRKI